MSHGPNDLVTVEVFIVSPIKLKVAADAVAEVLEKHGERFPRQVVEEIAYQALKAAYKAWAT